MIDSNLYTTNVLLGIMAAVSVLQALVLVATAILGYRLYRRTRKAVDDLEARRIAPLVARLHTLVAALDDLVREVKSLTARVTRGTERVDAAIDGTIHRVDETAGRVRASVASRMYQVAALAHGVRSAVRYLFNGRRTAPDSPAQTA